jgi:hypothetical protein
LHSLSATAADAAASVATYPANWTKRTGVRLQDGATGFQRIPMISGFCFPRTAIYFPDDANCFSVCVAGEFAGNNAATAMG